jgi:catecholate siderophore receptor
VAAFAVIPGTLHAQQESHVPQSFTFAISAGPLEEALVAFRAATHLTVREPADLPLEGIGSGGVSATCRADAALRILLAGTGLTFRIAPDGAFVLQLAAAPLRVEVTAVADLYRVDESSTATRTPTPLRDVPQTLAIVPRALLADQSAQSIADAVRNVPGVSVAQGEGNRDQVVLRGISTASDFFVNGVRDDQERFRDLYNVERVEVLQGPAAVLFGRGGAGGIVNIVTRRARRGEASDAAIEAGSFAHKRATAFAAAPVGSRASVAVSGMAERSGGFRDASFLHRHAANPTFTVHFAGASSFSAGVEHLRDTRFADRGIPSRNGQPVAVRTSQVFASETQNRARSGVDTAYAEIEHPFPNGATVRTRILAGRYDKYYQNVYPGSPVDAQNILTLSAYNHAVDRVNVFTQTELTYDTRAFGIRHRMLAGLELGRQWQDEQRHTARAVADVPLAATMRDADFDGASLTADRTAGAATAAVFLQDQLTLSSRWKAVAGVRVDRFAVDVDDRLPGAPALVRVDRAVSPRAGVIYGAGSKASLYASYGYTFLPSGQTLGLAANTAQLEPENARNYEAGARLDVLRGLSVTAAVFRLDRNHVRTADPTDPTRLVMTGQQRTEGVVLSAAGSVTRQLRIYGGYAHLDAAVTRTTLSAPAGRRVGLVPVHQATMWATYDLPWNLGLAGGIVAQSRAFTSFTNAVQLPAFTRVDAAVSRRVGRYRLALNTENLLDARYYPTANGDNNISPGAPRNVRLTVAASF